MFSLSMRQLLRTPMKSFLFIFLLACVTMLMVFGSVLLVQTDAHISQVENTFTTIGMVEQKPSSTRTVVYEDGCGNIETATYDVYDKLLTLDALNFEGADYIVPPENRNCYLARAYINNLFGRTIHFQRQDPGASGTIIAEVIPLEDSTDGSPVSAKIGIVLCGSVKNGEEIQFCSHHSTKPVVLKMGKKYMACMKREMCSTHGEREFVPLAVPYTSHYNDEGSPIIDGSYPGFHLFRKDDEDKWVKNRKFAGSYADTEAFDVLFQEEDESFSMTPWVTMAISIRNEYEYYPVMATSNLNLLPSFQSKNAQIADGRAITQEEFDNGAMVCLVPDEWNDSNNDFAPGGSLVLPLSMTLQDYPVGKFNGATELDLFRPYSFIKEDGKSYPTFSQGAYTIVGTYTVKDKSFFSSGDTELASNTIIIPAKSVTAPNSNVVYRGPLSSSNVSFQIPNGTIASFDKKLREAVPEAELLNITYHDNGYEDIIPSLERTRTTAILLCSVGVAGAVAVVIFLIYFFIARERRRTAIERGLGMTKRQCYISLISGVMALALLGTVLGSGLGLLLTNTMQKETEINDEGMYARYSTRYSDWTNKWNQVTDTPEMIEEKAPFEVFPFAIPVFLLALIFSLSMLMVTVNLRIEPIELLGSR